MISRNFNINEKDVISNVTRAISEIFKGEKPIIISIGTDLSIGDSLGPIVGTLLKERGTDCFIYGALSNPITAKDVENVKQFIASTHRGAKTLVIDAGIGEAQEVGKIKISPIELKPGIGVNKNLPAIGDASIIGIVAEKSRANYKFLNLTRLSPVYKMARYIACGIANYIDQCDYKMTKAL